MRESVTYQAIVAEGMIEARREDLLLVGQKRWGEPGPEIQSCLSSLSDLHRLGRMLDGLLDVSSWQELIEIE